MELAIPVMIGIALGIYAHGAYSSYIERLLYPTVWALVFIIGIGVGATIDEGVIFKIIYGALLVATLPGAISIAIATILARGIAGVSSRGPAITRSSLYRSPLVIVAFLLAGSIVGYIEGITPPSHITMLLLYILLFLSGYVVGGIADAKEVLHSGKTGLSLTLSCMVGGVIGGALTAFILEWNLHIGVAMGIASGWYSLAGPLLYTIDPYYGAVAFIGNMLREAVHIAVYPVFSKKIPIPAIAFGGATTMDTGLPVIIAYGGERATLAAFIQGALLTLTLSASLPLYVSILEGT